MEAATQSEPSTEPEIISEVAIVEAVPISTYQEDISSESEESYVPWSAEDVRELALTLAGECYVDEDEDKRLVCEVILNRVSDELFEGDTIHEVVSCTKFGVQFKGYWQQSRPVTDSDYAVAEQALTDWYTNNCNPLSEYRFFSAGDNHRNIFS